MKLLTLARDLRRRKARDRQGLFVAEGVRAVEELLRSSVEVRGALYTADATTSDRGATLIAILAGQRIPAETVTEDDFVSAAETDSPQGILAIGKVPDCTLADVTDASPLRLLVLDAVQDPGNVGTMVRTAAAFGVAATFSLPGTVDLWNAKVVRSAMGAHFHHLCLSGTWDELDAFRRERGMSIWGADASGDALDAVTSPLPPRLALVMGNEGSGLSSSSRARADRLVALPIATVESLNVAVAAGILLYELRR